MLSNSAQVQVLFTFCHLFRGDRKSTRFEIEMSETRLEAKEGETAEEEGIKRKVSPLNKADVNKNIG